MAHRIEVACKPAIPDALGNAVAKRIEADLSLHVGSVRTADVYTVDANLRYEQLTTLAAQLFADAVTQTFAIDAPVLGGYNWLIEVGFKPGVTDNVGKTSKEAITDMLGIAADVYTSRQYAVSGTLSRGDAERIATKLLANELIERWEVRSPSDATTTMMPKVELYRTPHAEPVSVDLPDNELVQLSSSKLLSLTLGEMQAIRRHFSNPDVRAQREALGLADPTDVELEALAQTWSEHCKHKIFNAAITYREDGNEERIDSLFDTYVKKSTKEIAKPWLVSVFSDNAGIIRFNDNWNIAMKVETHNAPSALEPYGGALTGIVGVNRDVIGAGLGARLVCNTDVFCFASPYYDKPLPKGVLHPKRIFEGVRRGVEHGGNKLGIPTVNGSIVFDDRFLGRPLVYCGTCGIMPHAINGKPSHAKTVVPGDLIVVAGGRTGKDGIHGATFSSAEISESSPVSAVQLGDPITQKIMYDFLLEARDKGLYRFITDVGGGGLSSAVGETARVSGGCEIHLDKCPLKYPGLAPWEILLSESQERMVLAVSRDKEKEFMELAKLRSVEATAIGTFTGTGKFHALHNGATVAYLDMEFLHDGAPRMKLSARWEEKQWPDASFAEPDLKDALMALLSRLNICSKEYVIRQYDHEVQGGSVVKPLTGAHNDGPSDAAVVRPLLESNEGIAISHGICPKYGDIDAYHMAACALDEAIRNAVAVGADPDCLAALDNFCWPDPTQDAHKLGQLVRANKALYDYTTAFGVPCISGKDSMKNDFRGETRISIPPTLLFSVVGKIADVRTAVTMDAKHPGDLVYILGETKDELGGSEYFAHHSLVGNKVPRVSAPAAKNLYKGLHKAMTAGLVASCHDCSDGGLGVALAETAFAGDLGMSIDLRKVPYNGEQRNDYVLFSETQSRFIVTILPESRVAFEHTIAGSVVACIGTVTPDGLFSVCGLDGNEVISASVNELKESWQQTLRW
ncbi:MAG: phosphoribosylformylglycinamidine synthase subunit PurL [Candidatus Aenigmarchaeota archaeon]|nr:phosphoribosylformylglycinamidine synthase subunit PurL [Candidatus Aenigmarchaeota archaeon]